MTPLLKTALVVPGRLLGAAVTGVFQPLAAGRAERSAARARARALDAAAEFFDTER
ncbi:hypothetical protein ABZV64_02975 [Streptomyces sp. NPDC004959]|uniref:hypothetical protein n=1 Tax=unclassified Streptomyces TaxID=2593676 RepID=UPI000A3F1F85|nr:hypothetical protein [Streptomyces sp. NRRL F-5630]